jgi:hypothetical protein
VVVRVCNPSHSEVGGRRIMVPGWPRKKHETLSEKQTKSLRDVGVYGSSGRVLV